MQRNNQTIARLIYVLKCTEQKWYVGKTNNIGRRYRQHLAGTASEWTAMYRPQSYRVIPCEGTFGKYTEDAHTLALMETHGIDAVRGGSYVQVHLDAVTRAEIMKKIWHANDLCMLCGSATHFARNCTK